MRVSFAVIGAALLLVGCTDKPVKVGSGDAERYSRDEANCRAQVRDITKNERNIDDSRNEVLSGERERYGQQDLPNTMAAMGDKNRTSRLMSSCMQQRGWQPSYAPWWQRIGL